MDLVKLEVKLAWAAVIVLVVIALSMAFSAIAMADVPTLADRVAALVPRFGSKKVELVDAQEFGVAVDTACKHDRECAARLVTQAVMESGLSAAVARSEYSEHQGDAYKDKDGTIRHRAWGTYQIHRNAHNADVWGSDDLLVQARAARALQLGALAECKSELGLWHMLAGRGCTGLWDGAQKRVALLAQVRRRL
jgi:hypothetical protein